MTKHLKEYELAKLLGVSVAKLRKDRSKGGGIPFIKFPGKRGAIRYSTQAVDEYLTNHTQGGTGTDKSLAQVSE